MTIRGLDVVRGTVRTVWERNPEVLEPLANFYGIDLGARIADDSIWQSLANRKVQVATPA
jgi:hypothetical protein